MEHNALSQQKYDEERGTYQSVLGNKPVFAVRERARPVFGRREKQSKVRRGGARLDGGRLAIALASVSVCMCACAFLV